METIFENLQHLTDPNWIMQSGGLFLVLLILFIETGLFFGFFLPGDPLLFISGMIIAGAELVAFPFASTVSNLIFWESLFIMSAIAGNFVGYWFGSRFGYLIVNPKKERWFLKQKHIEAAHDFYEKNGGFAITIARFLPVVRTFVPIVGGMVKMNFKQFALYNVLGAIIWVGGLSTLGFLLGENEWVNNNLEWTLLGIVVIATLPVIIKALIPRKTVRNLKPLKTK